ncbi:MAG: YjgN family protein [Pseudomonadota bacterium]|nr:YjgN family protein [Pseudomonadota bacterium]
MDRFNVIFLSQLQEGFQEAQVATSLSKALKITEEKALKLLRSDKNITLRRHIDQKKAQRISQHLNQLGIVTIVEDETPPEVHFQTVDAKPLDQHVTSKEQTHTDQSPSGEQEPIPKKALADDDKPFDAASFAQHAEPAMSLKGSAEPVAVATAKPDTDASSSATVDAFFAEAEQELALVDDDEPQQEQQTQTEEGAQHTEGSEQQTAAAAATAGVATKSLGASFDIHKDRIKAKTPETPKDEGGDETPERESFFDEPVTHPFVFKGSGIEYFKIWIVNTLLSIITLGIYSAWAKVKNRQYLYNNTYLDNHNFNYFANPVRILIGRILLAVLVICAYVATMFNIGIAGILFFIFYLLFPFFIHQSMRFNLNYTSYRNVRFYFKKSLGQSYIAYLLLPVASAFTLYLLWPFAVYKQTQFLANHAHYGSSSFESDFEPSQFYVIYAIMLGLSILTLIAISIAFGVLIGTSGIMMFASQGLATTGIIFSIVALYALAIVAYYVLLAFKQYRIRNLVFNHLQLDENRFESQVEFFPWLRIILTNALLIGITLGLFIPFAKVREMNYLSSVTYVHAMESLGNFAEHEHHTDDATGEAAGDILDLDVGFF